MLAAKVFCIGFGFFEKLLATPLAAFAAGKIVVQHGNAPLENYPMLGYVVLTSMVITLIMMWRINKQVAHKLHQKPLQVSMSKQNNPTDNKFFKALIQILKFL